MFFFVQGADGKIIPLSAATLQKLIDSGAIKPGTQVIFYFFIRVNKKTQGAIEPDTQVIVFLVLGFICASKTQGRVNPVPR